MVWTLLGVFFGGMALNLTPCVYPLIPITVSYFGGRRGKGRTLVHGLCYVGGLAITNSLVGVFAALTGELMGSLLQNTLVLVLLSGILIVFDLSLFGFWELRVPFGLMQAATKSHAGFKSFEWIRAGTGIVALVMATVLIGAWVVQGKGVAWQPYSDELLAEAREGKKPVILDFSADWCSPCREFNGKKDKIMAFPLGLQLSVLPGLLMVSSLVSRTYFPSYLAASLILPRSIRIFSTVLTSDVLPVKTQIRTGMPSRVIARAMTAWGTQTTGSL